MIQDPTEQGRARRKGTTGILTVGKWWGKGAKGVVRVIQCHLCVCAGRSFLFSLKKVVLMGKMERLRDGERRSMWIGDRGGGRMVRRAGKAGRQAGALDWD